MMNVFQPPTDNLYKFMAVSGIVLIVAGVLGPPVFFQPTGIEYLAQLRGSEELQVQEKFTNERLETLKQRGLQAIEEKKRLQKRLDGLKATPNSPAVDKLEGRIKEANHEIESTADAAHDLSLNLALKRAQIRYEETVSINRRRTARLFLLLGWGAGLTGIFFSFVGFRRWYKRLQQFQDRVVAKEAEAKLAINKANERNQVVQPNQPIEDNVPEPAK
jgi:hypothetical protein